jgi:hypothetical protein
LKKETPKNESSSLAKEKEIMEQEDWSSERAVVTTHIERSEVTSLDIFKLAKSILAWCAVLFVVLASGYVASSHLQVKDEMKEVWTFGSQALYGVVTLILGLYFGGKIKDAV